MRNNKAIGILAAVVTLGSALVIGWRISGGFGPHLDPLPHRAVGRTLARQTLSLLKPGGLVTVITRDTAAFENPALDILLASFRKELSKAGVRIESVHALQIDPLRPSAVPAGDFFQWIKNSVPGSVIVSLLGPPDLTEVQCAQLGEVKPAIIGFCPGPLRDQVDLRPLFVRGLLQAAVVSRRNVEPQSKTIPNHGESEAFDRQFIEVTPGNLALLSSPINSGP